MSGAAANHRGDRVIGMQAWRNHFEQQDREELIAMRMITEQCNVFVRECQAYRTEPRGLRESTILRRRQMRGWKKRHDRFLAMHAQWVGTSTSTKALWMASLNRALAMADLFAFELSGWAMPAQIEIPEPVRRHLEKKK